MSFDQRIRKACEFERTVLDALHVRGWTAELFGQGQLSEDVRAILRQIETPVRWMADIIGCKRFAARTLTVFIDAKAGELWRRTNKHDVEQSAAESANRWAEFSNCPVYFVFTDWSVTFLQRFWSWTSAALITATDQHTVPSHSQNCVYPV